jgi:microcystin-dependent protein
LFDVIEFKYGDPTTLRGANTFKIPDLRGRFPLGLNNMLNGDQIRDSSNTLINSSSGPVTRVNADTANNLGQGAGSEQTTINVSQLPDHTHTLFGNNGGQFYAINSNSDVPVDSDAIQGNGLSSTTKAQYLPHTSGIDQSTIGQPVSLMNPYLSINYIIYSGVPQ